MASKPTPRGAPVRNPPPEKTSWVLPVLTLGSTVGVSLVLAFLSRSKNAPEPAPGQRSPLLDPVVYDRLDIEAAARMVASENPRGSDALKREQIYTQIKSRKKGQSLYDRITGGADFGPQNKRRPVSTDRAPNALDYELAAAVLSGKAPAARFPSARKFFEPAQQNAAFAIAERARGKRARGETLTPQEERLLGYEKDADGIRKEWSADGDKALGTLEGVEFWT